MYPKKLLLSENLELLKLIFPLKKLFSLLFLLFEKNVLERFKFESPDDLNTMVESVLLQIIYPPKGK